PDLLAPIDPKAPGFDAPSFSFLGTLGNANPIPALPKFEDFDQKLSRPTHFETFRVYVPWVPFDKRGSGLPADYQVIGVRPFDEQAFVPLDLSQYYAQQGGVTGLASLSGPFAADANGFVPASEPLPFTANFQNDPASS